jgi:hypothetical protein
MSSTASTEVFGALSIKYTGQYPSTDGDQPEKQFKKVKGGVHAGPTLIGSYGSVLFETKTRDTKISFKATETTIQNLRGFNGSIITIQKPFGPLTATAGLELGPVKKLTANLKGKWNYSQKRFMELGAFWSERLNAQIFQVTAQPHANLKLQNTLNNRTQQLNTVVTAQHRGFTLAPAIDWKTGNKGATLSHKFRAGTLKATYAHDKQLAGLNYDFKPFNIGISGKISGKEAGKPTLLISFKSDEVVSNVKGRTGRLRGDKKHEHAVTDIPLEVRTRELDAIYGAKLAKAEAVKAQHEARVVKAHEEAKRK